jgi:undecaprenyl diphosphate synthase
MKFFGDISVLSPGLQKLIADTQELSKTFDGVQVNICLNYGGRDEILRAVELYIKDYADGKVPTQLDEETFSGYMYSAGIPDPDLVI